MTTRETSFRETSFRGKKPSGKVTIRETTVNQPFDAHCCHMGTAIKHPVPDRRKPPFVIFGIQALRRSAFVQYSQRIFDVWTAWYYCFQIWLSCWLSRWATRLYTWQLIKASVRLCNCWLLTALMFTCPTRYAFHLRHKFCAISDNILSEFHRSIFVYW